MSLPPKPCYQHLIILLHKVEAAIVWYKGCYFLAILYELYSDALSDGRVGLLGLHTAEGDTEDQYKEGYISTVQSAYTFSSTIPLA